ncbi:MAG: HAMP domain-containing protein, partial [Eubacteriales bacterium]|nr:HAMP domain-containing protein [Eubacteriales bacterium]
MKKKAEKKGTIRTKIVIMLILSIFISSLSIAVFSYSNYRETSIRISGEKALSIAQTIASGIDGDKFDQYQKTWTADEYFNQIKDMMSETKQRNNLAYVYSYVDGGDVFKYIISGYLKNEDQKAWGYLGFSNPKEIFTEAESLVLVDGKGRYTEPHDYGEEYGLLVSGLAPIFNSEGNVVGAVSIYLGVSEAIAEANKIIPVIALIVLLVCLILFAVSYFYINRSISRPIREIAEQSKLLQTGDTDLLVSEKFLKRRDEIGMLAEGFV